MNATRSEPDEPSLPGFLGLVLRGRQADDPNPKRAALIRELTGPATPPIVGTIARSSLGAPADPKHHDAAAAEAVARVLRRAAVIAAADSADPDPDDPIAEWQRDLRRLFDAASRSVESLVDELHGLGFAMTAARLTEALWHRPVCRDRELLRSVVTVVGGDWAGGGYEALYDAALDEQGRLDGVLGAPAPERVPSGLNGAEQLTRDTLLAQVRPPLQNQPDAIHGREDVLSDLVGLLDEPTAPTQLITGKGGSGKSAVALAVAAEALRREHHVWWVSAADPNQLTRGMLAVAIDLGAPLSELNTLQSAAALGAQMLWRRLQSSERRWLLIFDDADDPDDLRISDTDGSQRWFRPSDAGTVMITTRVIDGTAWGSDTVVTEIGDLEPNDGAAVILDRIRRAGGSRTNTDDPQTERFARHLSEQLGGVALALRNVGDYLGSGVTRHSIDELVRSLDARRLADSHVDAGGPRGRIATTWDLSLTALANKGLPEARTLLRLLACFAPGKWVVPLDVIAPDRIAASGLTAEGDGSPDRWLAALDGLRTVGLVDRQITAGHGIEGVVMHPLVAEVALDEGGTTAVETAAVSLLWQAVADLDAGRPESWPVLRRLEPHVYAVIVAIRSKQGQAEALRLANRTAEGLIRAGLFAVGEQLIRHARALTPLGPEHPNVLATEHTLAWALGLRGELTEAARRLTALIADRTRIDGAEHDHALLARDHLAWVLAEQGALQDAERMLRELLAIRERIDTRPTTHTIAIRHRIAWITAQRGHHREAESMFRAILPLRHAALGADHMEVFSTRYRLGWSVAIQGRASDAERIFADLAADLEQVLAPGSGPAIMVRARLGCVRATLGRFEEAERDHRFVLDARARLFGTDHPRTLRARHELAWMLTMKGDLRAAERAYREVLADWHGTISADHQFCLDTRGRLARLLVDTGQLDEAFRNLRALLPHRRRVCGPEHPATMITRYNLGLLFLARGQYRRAELELENVRDDQVHTLGVDHRHTLATRTALTKLSGRLGDLASAHDQILEIHSAARHTLGPDHPDTLTTRQVLVWLLGEQERLGEAERECNNLLTDRTRVFGAEHPDTLDTRYRLGWIHGLADRGAEAEQLYRSLIDLQHRVLGREHPHSLRTRHGLANELLRSGQIPEAEQELRRVLLDRTRTLGRTHPDTLSNRHSLALARALRGETAEAEQSLQDLLLDQLRLLGTEHRDTLATRERLAWLRARRGSLDEATEHWRLLLHDRERILGSDHPDTRRARERLASRTHEVDRIW